MKDNNAMEAFTKALSGLNAGQRKAVETIDGPVLVVAGPGTGKTQILTLRIANILLKTDTKPEQVLALTFTESGVRAMRSRLASFIGQAAYRVPIHTFHSFAGELIRRYPDSYDKIVGGRPASELEKIAMIENILATGPYSWIRPHGDPAYYVKPILSAIATLKKEYVSPDDFSAYIKKQEETLLDIPKLHEKGAHKGKVRGEYLDFEKKLGRNQELLAVYRLYESLLRDAKLYDFEDMILDSIKALASNESMLRDIQEQYLYVLADEHQDVNQSQNRLIELIASFHEHPNVFVVGDEKQAIYRFQGASLDNFLYFGDVYKDVLTIALETNYRSDQQILDLAHESIKTEDPTLKDLRIPLTAHNSFETKIEKRQFAHTGYEEAWVASEVKKYLAEGVPSSEVAIIVRTNKEVELFANLLRKAGIAAKASADSDILDHPLLSHIINLIKVTANPGDDVAMSAFLHASYIGLSMEDLVTLFAKRKYGQSFVSLFESSNELSLGSTLEEKVLKILNLLNEARALTLTKTPAEVLEFVLKESGFTAHVLNHDPIEGVRVVRRVYDEVLGMYTRGEARTLSEVVLQFERIKSHNLPITAPYLPSSNEAVSVLTAHKAKGLEYEVVFMPHLTDSAWGGGKKSELFDLPVVKHQVDDAKDLALDDERRLFYVALTRAKRVIQCSYSDTGIDGRSFTPSRFLVNLADMVTDCDTTDFSNNYQILESIKPVGTTHISSEFVLEALRERGWSATSFNNYTKSPWEYIYKNALRIPSIKTPELHFGTAVHAVLDKLVRHYRTSNEWLSTSAIKSELELVLGSMPITVEDFTRLHKRGLEAVLGYLPILESQATLFSKTEYKVEAVLETGITGFETVRLTGNFDRLDCNEDGVALRVVDYKTGKPKTRGEIAGTTKTSDGNYKRQLTFYALLLSLQSDEKLRCTSGRLSFVEPDSKGVIHEEDFNISEEDMEELKLSIIKATKEIFSGDCLKVACDSNKTEFCPLVTELMGR